MILSMCKIAEKDYSDGRTKQAFKDSTDINKILKKAQVAGGLAHAMKYEPEAYGEFTGVDLLGAFEQCRRAQAIFADLPAEVRREFDQDAFKFAGYASDPENVHRLKELIPAIAEPESFFVKPVAERAAELVANVEVAEAALAAAESAVLGAEPRVSAADVSARVAPEPALPADSSSDT